MFTSMIMRLLASCETGLPHTSSSTIRFALTRAGTIELRRRFTIQLSLNKRLLDNISGIGETSLIQQTNKSHYLFWFLCLDTGDTINTLDLNIVSMEKQSESGERSPE